MNRRAFVGSVAVASFGAQQASLKRPLKRPNFLLLLADDLTFRSIRALNNPEVHTPNLDRLVKNGCAFTHCFHQGSWQGAVCVPSRTMLNTGLSAFRAETQAQEVPTWGQTLRNAGYKTYMTGKWHLDPTLLARSFEEFGPVSGAMFESTPDAYNRPAAGNTWSPSNTALKGQWQHTKLWKNQTVDSIEHSSGIWADSAIDHLLNKAARRTEPFFMYVAFNAPHDPRQAPREFVDMYPPDKIEVPPNYLPEHPFDQGDHRVRDELLAPFPRTKEAVQVHRSEYYAILSHLDAQIGRILDALEQSGKAANTYVILTADHGIAIGQHGLMGKQNLYDHSVRMPLLISGPQVPRGKRIDHLVYQHSLYATTCELAGVPIPTRVEFPSLAGLLHGSGGPVHESVFCYYRQFQRSVRTKDHKLIFYPVWGRTQVFDLDSDPWETQDRSDDPAFRTIKEDLLRKLREHQLKLGDSIAVSAEYHTSVEPLAGEEILLPCGYDITIPAPDRPVRAVWVIFDRGMDYLNFYRDAGVREFAKKHELALLLPAHCRSKERDDMIVEPARGIGRALLQSLKQFAAQSGHSELADAKLIALGWSGAGSLAARLPGYTPDRMLASIGYAPGQYDPLGMDTIELSGEALQTPQLIIANGGDWINGTVRPYNFFRKYWEQGAPWTFVVQNRTPHCCLQNVSSLILAWVEAILRSPANNQAGYVRMEESNLRDEWQLPVSNIVTARIAPKGSALMAGEVPAGRLPSDEFAREWLALAQRDQPVRVWKP